MKLLSKPAAIWSRGNGGEERELTIYRRAGFVDQTVALDYAIREGGIAPGHVDRGGGQLAEVDEAGSTGSWKEREVEGQKKRGKLSINESRLRDFEGFSAG